jgi:hypothetical protein
VFLFPLQLLCKTYLISKVSSSITDAKTGYAKDLRDFVGRSKEVHNAVVRHINATEYDDVWRKWTHKSKKASFTNRQDTPGTASNKVG